MMKKNAKIADSKKFVQESDIYKMEIGEKSRNIAFAALFTAMGVGLPYGFHLMGLGPAFLPMHIPIILGALLLGPYYGFIMGLITPLLSSFLTGMPPFMPPVAPMMMVELSMMGVVAGYLSRIKNLNAYLSLVLTMLTGRIIFAGLVFALASYLIKANQTPLMYVAGSLIFAIPGFVLQLVVIPPIYIVLEKISLQKGITEPSTM